MLYFAFSEATQSRLLGLATRFPNRLPQAIRHYIDIRRTSAKVTGSKEKSSLPRNGASGVSGTAAVRLHRPLTSSTRAGASAYDRPGRFGSSA
jgi:hypothetical protein